MAKNFAETMKSARTIEERQTILQKRLGSKQKKEEYERLSGTLVTDVQEQYGFRIGDNVEYITALGDKNTGYVSHFAVRMGETPASNFGTYLTAFIAEKDNRPVPQKHKGDDMEIILVNESGGYATHHSPDLPKKLG